jgi:hypothetical protein
MTVRVQLKKKSGRESQGIGAKANWLAVNRQSWSKSVSWLWQYCLCLRGRRRKSAALLGQVPTMKGRSLPSQKRWPRCEAAMEVGGGADTNRHARTHTHTHTHTGRRSYTRTSGKEVKIVYEIVDWDFVAQVREQWRPFGNEHSDFT